MASLTAVYSARASCNVVFDAGELLMELNTMSVHALSERVENLEQQLAAAEAKKQEAFEHANRHLREKMRAQEELERVRSAANPLVITVDLLLNQYGAGIPSELFGALDKHVRTLQTALASPAAEPFNRAMPDDLRAAGLTVAVHNDYRLQGEHHTFWLFTRSDGMSFKGEGRSDAEALDRVREQVLARPAPATEPAKTWEGWAAFDSDGTPYVIGKTKDDVQRAAEWVYSEPPYSVDWNTIVKAYGNTARPVVLIEAQPAPVAQSEQSQEGEQ